MMKKMMTEPGAPCPLLEWLFQDCMPSYALPWVGVQDTRAQEQGPSTSDPLMQLPENLVYDWKLLHTIIFHCIFKSLSVYKILSRQSGPEDSWFCQKFTVLNMLVLMAAWYQLVYTFWIFQVWMSPIKIKRGKSADSWKHKGQKQNCNWCSKKTCSGRIFFKQSLKWTS